MKSRNIEKNIILISDKEVARMIDVSPSWVRKQRYLRKKGENHVLTIDPIRIGSMCRYRIDIIIEWINSLN